MSSKKRGRSRPKAAHARRSKPSTDRGPDPSGGWVRVPTFTKEDGHVYVTLIDDWGREVVRMVAELGLEAFVGPRPSPQHRVHHRNGDKRDNCAANLEWRLPIVPEPSIA